MSAISRKFVTLANGVSLGRTPIGVFLCSSQYRIPCALSLHSRQPTRYLCVSERCNKKTNNNNNHNISKTVLGNGLSVNDASLCRHQSNARIISKDFVYEWFTWKWKRVKAQRKRKSMMDFFPK